MEAWLATVTDDARLQVALLLVAADLVLGVVAAAKAGTFTLAKIGGFLKDDVLGKVAPFLVLLVLSEAADARGIDTSLIPGLDLAAAANVAFAGMALALVGSITSSLADLGVPLPAVIGRGEKPDTVDPAGPPVGSGEVMP